MSIFLAIIIYSLCLIFRKSKLLTVISFCFLWSLWGWNTWNGDLDSYKQMFSESIYENSRFAGVEVGYLWIVRLFYSTGASFETFLIIISGTVLFISLVFALKFTKYPALFSFFYFFIFVMEFVFIRNYIADSLLLLAIMIALSEKKNKTLISAGIILISSLFHNTAIVYLIFLYPIFLNQALSLKKWAIICVICMASSSIALSYIMPYLAKGSLAKLAFYASDSFWLITIAHFLLVIVVVIYLQKVLELSRNISDKWRFYIIFFININVVSLVYLSLYFQIPYFSRVLKILLALDVAIVISCLYFIKTKASLQQILMPFIAFLILFFVYYSKTNFPYTITPLFKCNAIWGNQIYTPK